MYFKDKNLKTLYKDYFKYFKDNWTILNKGTDIVFKENNGKIEIEFLGCNASQFFYLIGECKDTSNLFLKWVLDNKITCKINIENIKAIAKCLKKNAVSIEYTENEFTFNILSNDIEEKVIIKNSSNINKNFENILNKLIYTSDIKLSGEVLELFLNNNEITKIRTEEKLIEIPEKKIISILKDLSKMSLLVE